MGTSRSKRGKIFIQAAACIRDFTVFSFHILTIFGGSWQNIQMRDDLVEDDHSGYCQALEHIINRFKAVTHIGGCCGCQPQGIRSLQRRFLWLELFFKWTFGLQNISSTFFESKYVLTAFSIFAPISLISSNCFLSLLSFVLLLLSYVWLH